MKDRRILITGGAGFIGSELVRQLAAAGAQVVVVDNLVNGRRENLAGLDSTRVRLVVEDVREVRTMETLMREVDIVFHLACLGVRHSVHSPRENHEVNATGTLNLLWAARAARAQRFVNVSSSEVYGTARTAPMTEEHPTFPHTVYGASKLAGECYARAFFDTYQYPTVVVRPFNSFGPRCHHEGDSGEVIPKFVLRQMAGRPLVIFGKGDQTRDFTYVSDTAHGILLAGFAPAAVGQTINLGTGREIAINDLATEVAVAVGGLARVEHEAPRPGDVMRLCADTRRASELLGFEPTVTLREGLERLLRWYRSRPEAPEMLLEHEVVRNWQAEGAESHG